MLQNQGPTALGPGGSGLGMAGITPSAEIEFNIYNSHVVGTAFETNGAEQPSVHVNRRGRISPVEIPSVSCSLQRHHVDRTLTDLTTSATFSTSYTTNLQSVLGLSVSLVGFTGATGDGESVQTISGFSFSGSPSTTLTGTAGNAITGVEGSSTGTVLLGTFTDANQSRDRRRLHHRRPARSSSTGATARRRKPWPPATHPHRHAQRRRLDHQRRPHLHRGGDLRLHGHGDRCSMARPPSSPGRPSSPTPR